MAGPKQQLDRMASVIPMNPHAIQAQTRDMVDIIDNLVWDYKSRYRSEPFYLILGGNFLRRTVQECYEKGIIQKNGHKVETLLGLVLVKVKRDCLEVGE